MAHEEQDTGAGRSGSALERGVGRPVPERAGFMAQIEHCKREVACWPAWMKQTAAAPKWMEGWDD